MSIVVSPKPEFYELYSAGQVEDIIGSLKNLNEIPHKYTYFKESAALWDRYVRRMELEDQPNSLNSTVKLLELNYAYLEDILDSGQTVNVIDIGPGNALPVKDLLNRLNKSGRLGKYKAIDISQEMLSLAKNNIDQWFKGKIVFEGHILDIGSSGFTARLAKMLRSSTSVNVVLFLGGTIGNVPSPEAVYKKLHDSLGAADVFILGLKLDTLNARKYFNFTEGLDLPEMEALILRRLGIEDGSYIVEKGYDSKRKERYMRVRLQQEVTIKFASGDVREDVLLAKGSSILLWRYWHYESLDILKQLNKAGFLALHSSLTNDEETLVVISRAFRGEIKRS